MRAFSPYVRLLLLVFVGVLLVYGLLAAGPVLRFYGARGLVRDYAAHSRSGVFLSEGGLMYPLSSGRGERIADPVFGCCRGGIAYYSADDSAVMLLDMERGGRKRIPLPVRPRLERVHGVYCTGRFVFLAGYSGAERCVVACDLLKSSWRRMDGIADVRTHVFRGEEVLAVLSSDGRVYDCSAADLSVRREIAAVDGTTEFWDYSADSGELVWADGGRRVCIAAHGKRRTVRLPVSVYGVSWQPEYGEWWVAGNYGYGIPGVVVLNRGGRVIGRLAGVVPFTEFETGGCVSGLRRLVVPK